MPNQPPNAKYPLSFHLRQYVANVPTSVVLGIVETSAPVPRIGETIRATICGQEWRYRVVEVEHVVDLDDAYMKNVRVTVEKEPPMHITSNNIGGAA